MAGLGERARMGSTKDLSEPSDIQEEERMGAISRLFQTQEEADASGPVTLKNGKVVAPQVCRPVFTFETFQRLWKSEFPHLKVRGRGEDTYTDCYKIRSKMRFLINRRKKLEDKLSHLSDVHTPINIAKDLEDFFTGDCPETEAEDHASEENEMYETYEGTSPEDLELVIKEINDEIAKTTKHVQMHTAQREDAKKWIGIAEKDKQNGTPMKDRTVTLTMDMSQNRTVPSFPGD